MSPGRRAAILIVAIVILLFSADIAYIEWRNHKVETVPIGATEGEVVAIMGKPDDVNTGFFRPACSTASPRCYEWSIHNNIQYVCFGPDGRVACRGSYVIYT